MIPALWELLNYSLESLNINIIWSFQNAARIKKPYMMVNYTNVDVPDHDHYGKIDDDGKRINSSWRKALVDLHFYCNDDSYRIASKSAMLLATEYSLDKQVQLDVSIGNRLFLQRVPALMNESQYEDRAIYQFNFYYTELIDDQAGRIETVIVDGTYHGGIGHDKPLDEDGNIIGDNIADLNCREVITSIPLTYWDDKTTSWDDYKTIWGNSP